MKQDTMRKAGVWVILILTSLALVIPSIAILWNILATPAQTITIDPEDIVITTATTSAEAEETEAEESITPETTTSPAE